MFTRILFLFLLGCTAVTETTKATPTVAVSTASDNDARALAALMRVTIDGKAAGREVLEKSFNYESILLRHAGEHGFRYVDLTPLKSDFQRLRYSHQCAITGGDFSRDDCANFGNYAESVLNLLSNIDQAVIYKHLPSFGQSDLIFLGDTKILNSERRVRVEMYLRVYRANDQTLLYNDSLSRELQLGSKASREGMTIKLLNLVMSDGMQSLAIKAP